MTGMRPERKANGSWSYPRSKEVLEAACLQTITHYMDVHWQTLCGSSEKEGFADPTVLVGSADGFGFGEGEGLPPPCAGPCRPCICQRQRRGLKLGTGLSVSWTTISRESGMQTCKGLPWALRGVSVALLILLTAAPRGRETSASLPWWVGVVSDLPPTEVELTHKHNWKVLKHFIFVKYGCEKQSKMVYSLNHDIAASFILDIDPEMPISDLALSQCNRAMVHSYVHGQDWKVIKHFIYVQN